MMKMLRRLVTATHVILREPRRPKDLGGRQLPPPRSFQLARLALRMTGAAFRPGVALLGFALLAIFIPALAEARPGGGEGYSGGGGSGSGGGGGDGGGLIYLLIRLLIWLIFNHPVIGIPLTVCVIVAFVRWNKNKETRQMGWDSAPTRAAAPPPQRKPAQDLEAIRTLDPDFSIVLFDDFVFALYARAHQARANKRDLDALAPYLSESARAGLAQRPPAGTPVSAVVVGALRVLDVRLPGPPAGPASPASDPRVCVTLEIESNLTLGAAGREITQYVKERWRLVRGANVRTKPPQQVQSFHCPNCGAPFEPTGSDRCQYCGEAVSNGRFDWTVESITPITIEARPPALTGTVQEVGTNWPTIFHPDLPTRRTDLLRDDPTATDEALAARLALIYGDLNKAWTNLDLKPVRPYVSDGLFDYLQYWITAYKSQGLRNVLDGMRMTEVTLAKVVRDRWYDALTYRIWGTGRDSTLRVATGEVVAGNPKADRAYSEYWTLIRGAGVRGAPHADKACPNCGAALDTNMAGECVHCGAKITSGEFDWVLSKIEQDDSYTG